LTLNNNHSLTHSLIEYVVTPGFVLAQFCRCSQIIPGNAHVFISWASEGDYLTRLIWNLDFNNINFRTKTKQNKQTNKNNKKRTREKQTQTNPKIR